MNTGEVRSIDREWSMGRGWRIMRIEEMRSEMDPITQS
jgi:hypothetical protein